MTDAGEGRRATAKTPFLLGSTSKSFTALAAMQLVDAGRLDLDASARRYVPEFQLADQRATDRITVRQVLQQTTGMPATAGGPIVRSAADGTALEALHELQGTTLVTPPGTAFEYSNGNYVLAGLIVERASGEPHAQYVQRHIFTPLGMRHSYVALDAAKRAGLVTGHRYWFGLATTHGPTFRPGIQPAGYLFSTAQDMGRYLAMYLNHGVTADGQRIVSRQGLATMLAPGRRGKLGAWSDHADARYAMGWYVGGPWSESAQLHPGRAPDSSAMIAMFPRRDLAVVTLTNAANDLTLSGYPAAVDRVERNAIDALIGDPVDTGTSLHRYYLYVDLIAVALLAAVAWPLVRAARALRTRTRLRHRRLAMAGVVARAAAGVLLVALPALAFGWRASFLWQPDVFTVIVLLGALLLVTAALRLATLVRRSREGPTGGAGVRHGAGRDCPDARVDRPNDPMARRRRRSVDIAMTTTVASHDALLAPASHDARKRRVLLGYWFAARSRSSRSSQPSAGPPLAPSTSSVRLTSCASVAARRHDNPHHRIRQAGHLLRRDRGAVAGPAWRSRSRPLRSTGCCDGLSRRPTL
jgi:CubicO group peptidase (beta-lactamase class C family)